MRWLRRSQPPKAVHRPAGNEARQPRVDWRSWDPVAADYERVVAPHTATVAPLLHRAARLAAGAHLLDVGCGTGTALPRASDQGAVAIGCDPSQGMLRAGRAVRSDPMMVAADTINLPFRDATFDAATASFSLHLAPKLETALFDIKRALRPGGILAIATWEHHVDDLTKTWLALAEQTIGFELFRHTRAEAEPWLEKLGTKARLETTLRDAGFRPVTITLEKVRFEMSLDDYLTEKHVQPLGRFVRQMVRDRWEDFQLKERQAFEPRFGTTIVDLRDVLIASATKP